LPAPRSDEITPMCTFGILHVARFPGTVQPSLVLRSPSMSFGNCWMRLTCSCSIEFELSMTNRRSMSFSTLCGK
jgi:hypothetical protein